MAGIGGIILAGGQSSRMGQEKGLMPLQGRPMIAHVLAVLRGLCDEVVLVANDPAYVQFGCRVVQDRVAGQGPLAGICAGLAHSRHETNLLLSCDVPMMHPELLRHLLQRSEGHAVAVAQADGRMHPLAGVYRKSALPHLESCLAEGRLKLQAALAGLDLLVVDVGKELQGFQAHWLDNLNTMADLAHAELHLAAKKMRVHVRYFGMIADRLGKASEQVELAGDGRQCDLRAFFIERYPALKALDWKIALNQELVDDRCDVAESSEIVLLPPFAGG